MAVVFAHTQFFHFVLERTLVGFVLESRRLFDGFDLLVSRVEPLLLDLQYPRNKRKIARARIGGFDAVALPRDSGFVVSAHTNFSGLRRRPKIPAGG